MYKNVSLLLALATATSAWAQTPVPTSEASEEIRVRLVRTGNDIEPVIEIVEKAAAPGRATLIRTGQDAPKADNRGYMGVYLNEEGEQVSVASVADGSGAAEAGLKAGDVILSVDKKEVGGVDELLKAMSGYAAGDSVAIRAKRGDEQILFMVKLGKRPSMPGQKVIAREIGIDHKGKLMDNLRGLGYAGEVEDAIELEVSEGILDPAELDIENLDIKSFGGGQVKVLVQRKGDGGEVELHEIHESKDGASWFQLDGEGGDYHEGHEGHHYHEGHDGHKGHKGHRFEWHSSSQCPEGEGELGKVLRGLDADASALHVFRSESGPKGMFQIKVKCDSESGSSSCEGDDQECGKSSCDSGDVRFFKPGHGSKPYCDSGGCGAHELDEEDCHEPKGHGKRNWRSIFGKRSAPEGHGFQAKCMMGGKRGAIMKKLMGRSSGIGRWMDPGQGLSEITEGHGMEIMRKLHSLHGVKKGNGDYEFYEMGGHSGMGDHGGTGEMIEAMHELREEMHALREEIQELRGQVRRMKGNARQGASRGKRRSRKASRGIDAKVHTQTIIMTEDENGERHIEVIKD
ncbi:MAG: PDZ domain-containing protein [bacterium]|nr:PDZ domain-containing protein [bacterium]